MFSSQKKLLISLCFALSIPALVQAATYDDLMNAAKLGDQTEIEGLLNKGVDVNTTDPAGNTLLIIAAREGNLALVDTLIKWRAKLNARNSHGDSALRLAALKGHLSIVQRLVEAGAPVNTPDWTPLIYASFSGNLPIIKYLLEQKADINAASANGTTALMAALRQGQFETAKFLLQVPNIDLNLLNEKNETALDVALRTNNTELLDTIRQRGGRSAQSVTLEIK